LRASYLLIAIPLDEKAGDTPSVLDLAAAIEKQLWAIFSMPRIDSVFHMEKMFIHRKIGSSDPPKLPGEHMKSAHPGTGIGVFVAFKAPTQLDKDLGLAVWAPEGWQAEAILRVIEWSQKATHDLLGRAFGGRMPYAELTDLL
jgi:hypothetical protein